MATKVQRMVLWHICAGNGSVLIFTGQKSTSCGRVGPHLAVKCSECVLFGLTHRKWIVKDEGFTGEYNRNAYRITPAGVKAAGKREPEMKILWHGAHGVRWG